MKRCISIFGAILLTCLIGCAGTMKGIIRKDAKRVPFAFSDSIIGTANIQVVMPGGERFKGPIAGISSGSSETSTGSTHTNVGSGSFEEVESFAGNSEATLTGDMGNIMKCRFHITDIIIGLSSGGFGICQTADDSVIDIFF
jgi:hypothetical protein